jgi:hypothetical protein
VLAAAGMILWALGNWRFEQTEVAPAIQYLGGETTAVLAEFRAANPRVPPGAKVIFLDDPWPGQSFDASRIAELWFRDRKTQVLLNQISHLPPEEIAKADALFTWRDGKLIRVR